MIYKILEMLEPSIKEGHFINNQLDAMDFLQSKMSDQFIKKGTNTKKRE